MENQKTTKQNTIIAVLSLLLLASVGGNILQVFNTKEIIVEKEKEILRIDSVLMRKKELEVQFNTALEEINLYKGQTAELDTLLAEANRKLEEQRLQIARLIDKNEDYQVLQQRYAELQRVKNEYLKEIERLTEENKKLKHENTELTVALNQKAEENKNLKGKVDIASQLQVTYLSVHSYDVSSKGKQKATDKAKRVNRLGISFDIGENRVAPPGARTLYFRILSPEGYVMADVAQAGRKFKTDKGEEIPYSKSLPIQWTGDKMSKIVFWEQDAFVSGVYKVEIYIDGALAASEKITLY